jgi:hypothetical protein
MCPQTEEETSLMADIPYRELIGSLTHISHTTRPDIAYALGQVAQYSQKPGKEHWKAAKRILAYLSRTVNVGIKFGGGSDDLIGYCDSDYGGDLETRRSTSGSVFLFLGGPISWSSKRQTCVALSTTEAKFIATTEAAKEAVWLQRLLTELGRPQRTTQLRCDNQGAIALVKNPVFHQRTKHMDIRFFFIREAQEEGKIDINYINTDEQLADIFTKALASPRFSKLCNLLNIVEIPERE